MKVRLAADITFDSIVDGDGLRSVIWFQGCKWNCEGCHNPSTHDMNGGFEKDIDNIVNEVAYDTIQTGVTISGGDPFFQPESLLELCKKLKERNINIWVYTGFTFETLLNKHSEILQYIDIIVDGPFILEQKDLSLIFKGSSNQRIIDVQKSIRNNKIILWGEQDI